MLYLLECKTGKHLTALGDAIKDKQFKPEQIAKEG